MRRQVLVLMSIGSMLAMLAMACTADPSLGYSNDTLKRGAADDDDDDDAPAKSKPASSSSPASSQAPSKTPPPSPSTSSTTSSATPPATCDPAKATTKADCQKCCAVKPPPPAAPAPKPATSCACGDGSKCGALCANSVCQGDQPNVACGICLLVAKCDPNAPTTVITPAPSAADACPNVCNGKP